MSPIPIPAKRNSTLVLTSLIYSAVTQGRLPFDAFVTLRWRSSTAEGIPQSKSRTKVYNFSGIVLGPCEQIL